MLTKNIIRSLLALSVCTFGLAGFSAPANAWEQSDAWKIVDYETHNDSNNFVKGSYFDWTDQAVGWQEGEGWPYSYNFYHRYTTSNGGRQQRHGIAAWVVIIPQTGWYNIKTNYKRTENRTTAAQYYVYATSRKEVSTAPNPSIHDFVRKIENKTMGDPLVHKVVDQHGPNDEAGAWYYAEFGTVCMVAGEYSVVVLDSRDTDRSSSADATFWTYIGEKIGSEECSDSALAPKVISPVTAPLLLNGPNRR